MERTEWDKITSGTWVEVIDQGLVYAYTIGWTSTGSADREVF